MNKAALLAVARFAPRLIQVRRGTWIGLGLGLLALTVLLAWAALAFTGWFFGQARGWMEDTPAATRGVLEQAQRVIPGPGTSLGEHLGDLMPVLKPARRDVSGSDLGPVPRYPGMARTFWHREGKMVTIEYEGEADYAAVLAHYGQGFAAQGFTRTVSTASPGAETHLYARQGEQLSLTVRTLPRGEVSAHIELPLP